MAKLFGERFKHNALDANNVMTTEFSAWAEQLDGLSTDQLTQGWATVKERFEQRLLADEPNFPPNEHEFRILCTKKQGNWEHNTAAYREDDPSKLLADHSDHPELKAKADKARIKALEIIRGESNDN